MRNSSPLLKVIGLLGVFALQACTQPIYYWGSYEENLYQRATDTSEEAQTEAFKMLEKTIKEAEEQELRIAPGVYGDYGYLLFKQGRTEKAIANFHKEAALYPESKYFIESIISRIQNKE